MKKTHWSTWYKGTEAEWQRLPMEERENLAFTATGCEVAYPTWESPVDCVHGGCQVRRGEVKPIRRVNGALRYERESGWLRFQTDRKVLATLYRHLRNEARRQQVWDIWKLDWQAVVYTGISV